MNLEEKEFWKVSEVAELFNVTVFTVRNWIKDGKIEAKKMKNGRWTIHRRALKTMFEDDEGIEEFDEGITEKLKESNGKKKNNKDKKEKSFLEKLFDFDVVEEDVWGTKEDDEDNEDEEEDEVGLPI